MGEEMESGVANEHRWHGRPVGLRHLVLFAPQDSFRHLFFLNCLLLQNIKGPTILQDVEMVAAPKVNFLLIPEF
jgi:hypothetical protein